MNDQKKISTCFLPALFEKYTNPDSIVVVIDVLRATSVISTAFHYGIKEIIPVQSLEEAKNYQGKANHIVAAERNAIPVDGFDYGNSPFHYMNDKVKDKTLVLTTTNGTKALEIAKPHSTITASFVNFDAVVDYLISQNKAVILLCSGWKGFFNLEDSIFAGKLAEKLMNNGFQNSNDSTLASIELFHSSEGDLLSFLSNSSHRKRLKNLNMEEDTKFCLSPTFFSNIVPILKDGKLIKA
jgi:2-phosphosulfolactate phosphatase